MNAVLQASLRSNQALAALPEYGLSFHPPLIICNSIPYEITVMLSEGRTGSTGSGPDTPSYTIAAGGSLDLQEYDLSQKIFMYMQIQVDPHASLRLSVCDQRRTPRMSTDRISVPPLALHCRPSWQRP